MCMPFQGLLLRYAVVLEHLRVMEGSICTCLPGSLLLPAGISMKADTH